jgi:tetratricopeptide (TPR) repeat protein
MIATAETRTKSVTPLPLADTLTACEALVTTGQPDAALRIWDWLRGQAVRHSGPWTRAAALLTKLSREGEAEALLLEAHAEFADGVLFAFIDHARGLRQVGGPNAALGGWALIRARFPHHPVGFIEAAACLRELKQFDAAAELLSEAQRQFPDDLTTVREYAKIAEFQKDWPVALERWSQVCNRFPDHWVGYGGSARALLQLKRQEDADALLRAVSERFSEEVGLLPDLARVAEGRRDWQEALRWWTALRDRAPERSEGHLRMAKCLNRLGENVTAEQLLSAGMEQFPHEQWFWFEYAQIAESTHDYETALARWETARVAWPAAWQPYGGLCNCLRNLKNYPAAQDLLIECLDRFPDEVGPLTGLANLVGRLAPAERHISLTNLQDKIDAFMARRGVSSALLAARATVTAVTQDWKAYHDELAIAVLKFPHDTVLGGMFAAARELHVDEDTTTDKPEAVPVAGDKPLTIGQILSQFDSLGGGRIDGDATRSYGCEFGLIQRDAGIEPLSLLRWSATAPDNLIRMLDRRMEDIGSAENLHVSLTKSDEWGFVERTYGVACNHTNMFGASVTEEMARQNIAKRQKFLARKLRMDLEEASKIFVYRVLGPSLSGDVLDRLFGALRRYGPNTLLYVCTADEGVEPFTVRWVKPGLMIGYIDWFRDGETRHAANVAGWRRICTEAFQLWLRSQAQQSEDRRVSALSADPVK